MQRSMIEITVAIAGLILAWLTYKKTFLVKSKEETACEEEMETFLAQFRATQKLSKQLQELLIEFATTKSLLDEPMFPNITYRMYVEKLKENYEVCLSDELYNKLANEKYTLPQIRILSDNLNIQFKSLSELKNQTMLYMGK